MKTTARPRKLADLDTIIPGLAEVWKQMKADCRTSQRTPKTVEVVDYGQKMCPNDTSCCRRFALDLRTMKLVGALHVSAGEWAVHGGDNHDKGVDGIGDGQALIDCEWNDYYKTFYMRIQVREGAIVPQLAAGLVPRGL